MVPRVIGIADDVLAKGDDEMGNDVAVLNLLETAGNNNVKFNPDKIQFKIKEGKFFGQLLTPEDMSIDPEKLMPSGRWMHHSVRRKWRASKVW